MSMLTFLKENIGKWFGVADRYHQCHTRITSKEISSTWPLDYCVTHWAFEVMREEFVQVLHSGCNHWLAVSIIGCPPFYSEGIWQPVLISSNTNEETDLCLMLTLKRRHLLKCLEEGDMKPFPCETVTQQKNKWAKLKHFASAKQGKRMVSCTRCG